jgi:hypothetical protein
MPTTSANLPCHNIQSEALPKGYLRSYQLDQRKKIAIGINFSSEKRSVDEFLIKESE